jgi:protein TonB
MLLHAFLLFGISVQGLKPAPRTLEVTLVTLAASEMPWQARALAPAAQHGSGQGPNEHARAQHSAGMIDVPGIRSALDSVFSMPASAQSGQNGLSGGSSAVRAVTTSSESWQQNSSETAPQPGTESEQRAVRREQSGFGAKDAEFNQLARAPGRVDPALDIAPDARPDPSAGYLDLWRRQIERVGSANFPWDALIMGHSNSLTMLVAIRADGTVSQARIARSSGSPMLDRAALNILHMASPFPAFPAQLRNRTSELGFSYVWQFLPGDSSSNGAALRLDGQ